MIRRRALEMIYRRAKAAGIQTQIGYHTFRAIGITIHLTNGGTLEKAQMMAAHSTRAPPSSMIGRAMRSAWTRSSGWCFNLSPCRARLRGRLTNVGFTRPKPQRMTGHAPIPHAIGPTIRITQEAAR